MSRRPRRRARSPSWRTNRSRLRPTRTAPRPCRRPVNRPEPPRDSRAQSGAYLTTAGGVRLPDTDHSLRAGSRGPTVLQDHHLREKITHFDHERIPERVVHARGGGARRVRQLRLGGRGEPSRVSSPRGSRPPCSSGSPRCSGPEFRRHSPRHPGLRGEVLHRRGHLRPRACLPDRWGWFVDGGVMSRAAVLTDAEWLLIEPLMPSSDGRLHRRVLGSECGYAVCSWHLGSGRGNPLTDPIVPSVRCGMGPSRFILLAAPPALRRWQGPPGPGRPSPTPLRRQVVMGRRVVSPRCLRPVRP
jgi:hypothetical protein